jgi:polyhydroxyalkanoate synthesis regulator phasin
VSAPRSEGPRPVSELLLAGLGLAGMSVEVADELAEDLARRLGIDPGAMRDAVRDTFAAWRAEAERLGARRDEVVDRSLQKAGVARREELEDLGLRVAQLEHRLRLLEDGVPS